MTKDLTLAIIALSMCLWMIVIHIQTPVELLFQTKQSTIIGENDLTMISLDNNSTCMGSYQSSFDLVPTWCKVTKAITNKEENAIGIINFLQFSNGIIQVSGEINDVNFSNFYLEIEAPDNKVADIIIRDDELFVKRECGTDRKS